MELERHLPRSFDFYGLGTLESRSTPRVEAAAWAETAVGLVTCGIAGDTPGTFVVAFDQAPQDYSMYLEIVNIITAKALSHHSHATGHNLELTPPHYIDGDERIFLPLCQSLAALTLAPSGNVATYEFKAKSGPSVKMVVGYFAVSGGHA